MSMRASEGSSGSELSRLQSVVAGLDAVIWEADAATGRFTFVSEGVRGILGHSPREWLAEPSFWEDHLHPEDRAQVRAERERVVASGERFTAEYRMLSGDGRSVWFRDDAVLVRDDAGNPLFWQGVMHDVTQRHRADELERDLLVERETARRLREIDEMKNTFLQAVSHDLRTPLAVILGLALTLGRTDLELDDGETREMAGRIATNARRLDRLVHDLLDMDRLSRGIIEPVRKPVELGELVSVLVKESDLVIEERVQLDLQRVMLPVDAAKVERIVENLLANACKHTPGSDRIWVSVRPHEGGALIEVADDGPGVPEELWEEIFEPFRRGPSPPGQSPGVGIGLSLVARFAELHGGRAWVEHREDGGASFRVFLPGTGTRGDSGADPAPGPRSLSAVSVPPRDGGPSEPPASA